MKKKYPSNTTLYLIFYELFVEYQTQPSTWHLKELISKENFLYNHQNFHDLKQHVQEEDEFIVSPPQLSEGIMTCKFCNGTKTLSYEKQTRSADEQSTIFVKCLTCNKSFRM